MNILTVVHSLGRGGTQRAAEVFTREFQAAGHDVAVMTTHEGGIREPNLRTANIPIFVGDGTPDGIAAVMRQAKQLRPDIVHIHRFGYHDRLQTDILAEFKSAGAKVVETNVFGRPDFRIPSGVIDCHFHISKCNLWRWRRWIGRRSPLGVIIPNPVDTSRFRRGPPNSVAPIRTRLGLNDNDFLIGRIGQASNASWHPACIEAFIWLATRHANVHFAAIGLPAQLRSMVSSCPKTIKARVHQLDYVDTDIELANVYSAFDLFLHAASAGETFGYVIAEAMLCDCPVLTCCRPHKANGHLELAVHTKTGFVAASVGELAASLAELYEDQPRLRSLTSAARQHIVSRFNSPVVAASALRVMASLIGSTEKSRTESWIADRIAEDPSLVFEVTDAEVKEMLRNSFGRLDYKELWAAACYHHPFLYRMHAKRMGHF